MPKSNDNPELIPNMQGALNNVIALLRRHDDGCHGGEPCLDEYANTLGYLIHRLGLYSDVGIARLVIRAGQYQAECIKNVQKN